MTFLIINSLLGIGNSKNNEDFCFVNIDRNSMMQGSHKSFGYISPSSYLINDLNFSTMLWTSTEEQPIEDAALGMSRAIDFCLNKSINSEAKILIEKRGTRTLRQLMSGSCVSFKQIL